MEKKEFIELIHNILKPHGFKRKNSKWISEGECLIKTIYLQRSYYSNLYYINCYYTIKGIDYKADYHIDKRLDSFIQGVERKNRDVLDFENSIPDEIRTAELVKRINDQIVNDFNKRNTDEDILKYLLSFENPRRIQGVVVDYFNLNYLFLAHSQHSDQRQKESYSISTKIWLGCWRRIFETSKRLHALVKSNFR